MQLTRSAHPDRDPGVVSYWRLGQPITGGRWYHIFRAAPKATAPDGNFDYVIKLVNPELAGDDRDHAIARLGREAFVTEKIQHPNVIQLLDAELDQSPFFLVQPWIEGQSLDRQLSSATHVSLSRLLWTIRQTAESIRAAHDMDRVYLGLEPSHVLLGRTGRVTLIGWSHSHRKGQLVTLPHDRVQLARYMAPECFADGYRAEGRSDVYSLGALIYHAVSKCFPFSGATVEELARSHADEIPEDLFLVQPICPPALSALVKQMLAKRPQQRPSFRDVLNELVGIEIEHLSDQSVIRL